MARFRVRFAAGGGSAPDLRRSRFRPGVTGTGGLRVPYAFVSTIMKNGLSGELSMQNFAMHSL